MAKVITSGEQSFQPVDPKNAPRCSKCEYFAYNVYQANCCGAYFCKRCFELQQKSPDGNCLRRCGKLDGQMLLDFNQSQERLKTVVYCYNKDKGCTVTGMIKLMDEHRNVCQFEMIKCKHKRCTSRLPRKYLADHESKCPNRTVTCQYCGDDTLRASHYEQFHLNNGCQRYPKPCRNGCGDEVTEEQWSSHQLICSDERVPCSFSQQGCPVQVRRREMDQHVASRQHMELLLKEINLNRTLLSAQSAEICRLQGTIQSKDNTHQSLQSDVHSLKSNATRANQNISLLKKSHEEMKLNQQQIFQQIQGLEDNFKLQQKAFQNFKQDCTIMYDNISLAKMTPPLKFVVYNVRELTRKGKCQESYCFYTECRRHQLKLAIFPGGKNGAEGQFVSVWLYRVNGPGTPTEDLPDQMKIIVSLELVNQLPMANESKENHAVQLDAVLNKNQTDARETLICEKNNFIEIGQLDHKRRETFSFTARFTQYIMSDRLTFLVKYAGEAF
ncbi:TNF receptor-associated factor 5-like [Dysidea avara]|uniref:TNF receptor-associated factor 5-like n=1 Tax=Dysidea avara TaxID=196820 RepID=UPI0033192F1E